MTDLSGMTSQEMVRWFLEAPVGKIDIGERKLTAPEDDAEIRFDHDTGGLVVTQQGREIGRWGGRDHD